MIKVSFAKLVALVVLLTLIEGFSLSKSTASAAGGARQTARSDSWLDRAPVNWNRRMSPLPRPASSPTDVMKVNSRCHGLVRQPDSPAERALVRAGWMLYGQVQYYGLTKVVTAMSGVDGMCRPLGYQAFAYWEGRYAGTLSPVAMNSRTDGALINIRIVSPTRILAEFARYSESDPLCCPTRISHVMYEVSRDYLPLVIPVSINTAPVGRPAEGPDSEDDSSNASLLFGKRWMLTEINGAAIRTSKPYIEFDREAKRFAGDGGCNRIAGGFELDGTNLRFLQTVSTKRACLDGETQQVETNLLKGLERTSSFQIRDDLLRLYASGSPVLTFKAEATGAGGASQEARVTGTVTYLQRMALSPNAVVEVKLLDVSLSDARAVTIAEQVIRPAGRQVPIAFELRYDPSRIQERRRYVVQARILVGGRLRFINTDAYPVITGGHPDTVNLIVKPVR